MPGPDIDTFEQNINNLVSDFSFGRICIRFYIHLFIEHTSVEENKHVIP